MSTTQHTRTITVNIADDPAERAEALAAWIRHTGKQAGFRAAYMGTWDNPDSFHTVARCIRVPHGWAVFNLPPIRSTARLHWDGTHAIRTITP